MGCKAKSWRAAAVIEDSVDSLQENITEDVEADASVSLDTSEASRASGSDWRVVDVLAWNGEGLAANGYVEVWWGGRAWEGVSTLRLVKAGTLNLAVVRLDSAGWEVEERSASVSNGGAEAAGSRVVATCGRATSSELPKTLRVVHWNICDGTRVLGAVNVAKGVAAGCLVLEVYGEERLGEGAADGIEECRLLLGLHSVDAAERKTEETIIVGVLGERRRDRGGSFNCLRGSCYTANDHLVSVDIASCARLVTVGDIPGVAV